MYEATSHVPLLNGPPRRTARWRTIVGFASSVVTMIVRAFQLREFIDEWEFA